MGSDLYHYQNNIREQQAAYYPAEIDRLIERYKKDIQAARNAWAMAYGYEYTMSRIIADLEKLRDEAPKVG